MATPFNTNRTPDAKPRKAVHSLGPADFRNVVMLSQSIQVPVEVLEDEKTKHLTHDADITTVELQDAVLTAFVFHRNKRAPPAQQACVLINTCE